MDWKNLLIQIAAFVVAALVAWVLAKVRSLISVKVKNEKARGFLTAALDAVSSAVKGTYQTYVESIKGTDAWTKDAQEEALHLALTKV